MRKDELCDFGWELNVVFSASMTNWEAFSLNHEEGGTSGLVFFHLIGKQRHLDLDLAFVAGYEDVKEFGMQGLC